MKTLLEAIQKHPATFIHTLQHRQFTSTSNKEAHQKMIDAIDAKDWGVSQNRLQTLGIINPWKVLCFV